MRHLDNAISGEDDPIAHNVDGDPVHRTRAGSAQVEAGDVVFAAVTGVDESSVVEADQRVVGPEFGFPEMSDSAATERVDVRQPQ